MSMVIEVFRSDDYIPDSEIPLVPFLRGLFRDVIGPTPGVVRYRLSFYELTDLTPDYGKPTLVNLRASHGFVRVRISREGVLLYQHPHPVRELIGEPLRELLRRRDPDVTHWGYGLRGPGLEGIALTRPAPQVRHEMRVPGGPRRRSTFTVEEMPDPQPPPGSLAALGANTGAPARTGPIRVVAPRSRDPWPASEEEPGLVEEDIEEEALDDPGAAGAADDAAADGAGEPAGTREPPVAIAIPDALVSSLVETFPFSAEIEEGGFLVGRVYRDSDHPDGYLVHVTAAISAQRTGASMIGFTFTGESFLRVSEQIAARGDGEALLGWYHTHLFPATSESHLSSVDEELHRTTFRRPWQIAALVNISSEGRVLRFYRGTEDGEMAQVPYWTVPS
jgi:hypothetical protein